MNRQQMIDTLINYALEMTNNETEEFLYHAMARLQDADLAALMVDIHNEEIK